MAFSFMSWFNRSCMTVAADDHIMPESGITTKQMGTVYSAFFFVYTICMTPGGWVADRFGPRFSLSLMGFGSAVCVACTGIVGLLFPSAGMLLIALLIVRGVMGVFTAPIYPSTGRTISYWMPIREAARTNGWVQGSAGVANASSYLVFAFLISLVGWQRAFLVTGAITAVVAIIWLWYARNRPADHPGTNEAEQALAPGAKPNGSPRLRIGASDAAESGASWVTLLRNRSLVLLTLSYAAIGYFEYLFIFWTHYYLEQVHHVSSTESKLYAGITQVGFAIGMFGGGWLSDRMRPSLGHRWGRAAVPLIGMPLSALFLMCGLFAEQPGWIVLWIAMANAAVGLCEGPIWATAIEMGGERGATAAGICNTGGNAGGTIAPAATPWLQHLLAPTVGETVAWRLAIGTAGVLCLLGVSLWFWIDPSPPTD
jgi:MFS family permease